MPGGSGKASPPGFNRPPSASTSCCPSPARPPVEPGSPPPSSPSAGMDGGAAMAGAVGVGSGTGAGGGIAGGGIAGGGPTGAAAEGAMGGGALDAAGGAFTTAAGWLATTAVAADGFVGHRDLAARRRRPGRPQLAGHLEYRRGIGGQPGRCGVVGGGHRRGRGAHRGEPVRANVVVDERFYLLIDQLTGHRTITHPGGDGLRGGQPVGALGQPAVVDSHCGGDLSVDHLPQVVPQSDQRLGRRSHPRGRRGRRVGMAHQEFARRVCASALPGAGQRSERVALRPQRVRRCGRRRFRARCNRRPTPADPARPRRCTSPAPVRRAASGPAADSRAGDAAHT